MTVINLKAVRKQRKREADKAAAAEARARHGRTKARKAADEKEAERLARTIDNARREPPEDPA